MDTRRIFIAVSAVALVATACSESEESGETMPPITTDVSAETQPSLPTTSEAPVTTMSPTSTGVATTVPPTTAVSTTAAPTTAGPTTVAPTTAPATTAPTTTPASTDDALQLRSDGLGPNSFGNDAETVITAVTGRYGAPTRDDGWVDPLSYGACPGDRYRQVVWNDLTLEFSEEDGQQRFIGYVYGSLSGVNPQPPGLVSGEGIGLGSTVADLRAAYPNVTTTPGEPGLQDPRYAIPDTFAGFLNGVADDSRVISVEAGRHCGG